MQFADSETVSPANISPRQRLQNTVLVMLCWFALGLLPRLVGITWGLPDAGHWFSYHPDERQIAVAVANLDLLNGDWNPNFFNYPSLFIYATALLYQVWNLCGLSSPAVGDAPWPIMHDITLCGRMISAFAGALTVPLVFFWAKRTLDDRAATLAALLCALAPGLVQHAHFATVDIAATFGMMLTIWLACLAHNQDDEKVSCKYLLASSLVCGLAAATKYNAIIVAIVPLWMSAVQPSWRRWLLAIVGLVGLGFVLGCPYSVLDFSEFWGSTDANLERGFAYELLTHPRVGSGEIFQQTGNGWWLQFSFNLPFALTWPLLLAALFGIGGVAKFGSATHRKYLWPVLGFCALYFVAIGSSQVRYLRYVLPIAPLLCGFAAASVAVMQTQLSAKLARVFSWILFVFAALGCRDVLIPLSQTDARDTVAQSFQQAPQINGTPPVIGLAERPWFYSPPFVPQNDGRPFENQRTPDGKWEVRRIGFDAARLQRELPQFFVISEFEWRDKVRLNDAAYRELLQVLEKRYQLTSTFKVQAPLALPGRAFVPHDYLYVNPTIRIYQRKEK